MKKIFLLFLTIGIMGLFSVSAQSATPSDAPNSENITPISTDNLNDSVHPTSKWKDYWKLTGILGFNISQTQFFNWAAGGNNNFTGVVFGNVTLNYTKKRVSWVTNFDSDFGMMYSSELIPAWRKSNDKINFSTKFGYKVANMWYITALGSFKSQYCSGWTYPQQDATLTEPLKISNWLSPSYTDISVGIDWKWKDIFSIYLSPVAGLITTCTDSLLREKYSVNLDKAVTASLGLTFKASVNYTLIKNFKIISAVQLYSPYTDKEQPFGNFNVDWDFAISYQFLKVLNVTLSTSLKYYEKTLIANKEGILAPRVQFKEVLGIGVGYSF